MARFCVAFAATAVLAMQGAWAGPPRHIDLRYDGALDDLQRVNPAHYVKVRQILEQARRFPGAGPVRGVLASVNALDVLYSENVLLTSFPPKQTVHFRLDDVRYTVNITRHDVRAP